MLMFAKKDFGEVSNKPNEENVNSGSDSDADYGKPRAKPLKSIALPHDQTQ